MAEETQDETQAAPEKKSGMLALIVVAILALSCGVATPILVTKLGGASDASSEAEAEPEVPDENDKPTFVMFGDVTVNLDSDRLNRFLHIDIALQVRESKLVEIEKDIEIHKHILNNWLISFLADQNIEEIRGANGHNRLRREIRDQFNTLLFKGGVEHIEDVLFQEFNVQ